MYKLGSRFVREGIPYMLVSTDDGRMCVVNMNNGQRLTDSFTQEDGGVSEETLRAELGVFAGSLIGVNNDFNKGVSFNQMKDGKIYELNVDCPAMMYVKFAGELFYLKKSNLVVGSEERFRLVKTD